MRLLLATVLALALVGCGKAPVKSVPIPLRNPTAQVGSQADATVQRLQGDWIVVQGAGVAPGSRVSISGNVMTLNGQPMPFTEEGAGRFTVLGQTLWVHWLDIDNRTAALGDPGGSRVWIMDRTGKPGERLGAAREILAWYGYDLRRLEGK